MKLIHSDLLKFAFEFANQSKKILKNNYFKKFSVEEKDDGKYACVFYVFVKLYPK